MEALEGLFRWVHIVAGIFWSGHLSYFNFVTGPFEGTPDAAAKKKVIPALGPGGLACFRWGAAWTWITGFLLVLMVFYHGQLVFDMGGEWNALALVMVAVTFLAFAVYDPLAKQEFAKNNKQMAGVAFVLVVLVVLGYKPAGFGYRAYVIHTGAISAPLMAT